jgi:hypothetical protein
MMTTLASGLFLGGIVCLVRAGKVYQAAKIIKLEERLPDGAGGIFQRVNGASLRRQLQQNVINGLGMLTTSVVVYRLFAR